MKYIIIYCCCIVCNLSIIGQNLVLNPSFEDTWNKGYSCPTLGYLISLHNWEQSTRGSVDYYQNGKFCLRKDPSIKARTGKSFIGQFSIESATRKRYREYLQGKFSTELQAGKEYYIEFYAQLDDASTTAVSGIGAYINNELITRKGTWRLHLEPQIKSNKIINDKKSWVKISGKYIASGGESYITIGNYDKFRKLKKEKPPGAGWLSYYYIDDVSVIEIPNEIDTVVTDSISFISEEPLPVIPPIEEKRILENIHFPTNKWDLDTSSNQTLNKLYNYLLKNPFLKIQINGYTDNKGREEFNLNLSEKRAQSVVDYLIEKGISETRLNYKGLGGSNPIDDNETEEGRANNRRIEIVVKENGGEIIKGIK